MPLTPETLARHELAGLHVEVVDAPNPDLVGIEGRVVRETMRTLVVRESVASGGRQWQVPKEGTTFEFALTDEAAPDREAGGTASKPSQDTAGADPDPGSDAGQSCDFSEPRSEARRTPQGSDGVSASEANGGPSEERSESDGGEGAAYVTVDGARLLSRPARRTETGGAPTWR